MVSIGRINIGRKEKRAFFPLNHDVETTSDFGFCQPTLVRQFIKGSKINLQTLAYIRLSALPCPTFGRLQCKQHTAFVPMCDVFEAFDYQQSNKAVSSALRSYIPSTTDWANNIFYLHTLFHIMYGISTYYSTDLNKWLELLPFRLSLYVNSSNIHKANAGDPNAPIVELIDAVGRSTEFDIFNDVRIWGAESTISDELRKILFGLGCHIVYIRLREYLDHLFQSPSPNVSLGQIKLDGTHIPERYSIKLPLGIFSYMYTDVYGQTGGSTTDRVNFGRHLYNNSGDIPGLPAGTYNWGSTNQLIYRSTDTLPLFPGSRIVTVKDSRNAYIFDAISAENADMMFKFDCPTDYWYNTNFHVSYTGNASVGVHFTPNGKRIMKVLTASRINFGRVRPSTNEKLYAYYKVWFDKYNAGRNLQWRDTFCYKLIHTFYDTGVPTSQLFYEPDDLPFAFTEEMFANLRSNWMHFILELANCTYCSPLDNITVATDSPILENTQPHGDNAFLPGQRFGTGATFVLPETRETGVQFDTDDSKPYYTTEQNTGLSIRMMQTLYKLVNKNSVLGSKVDDYLRAHGIANGLPKSMVLGDQQFPCGIDEVFATVNNDQTALGEYGGKGIGAIGYDKAHPAKTMHFECDTFGYLIQLTTLVPIGGYVQAMGHDCITRYDFYQSEFDSLGMEALPQSSVIGRQFCFGENFKADSVFGFVPRYFNLKVENNLANGGFAFPSEMANFLPYSLDKIFTTGMPDDFINREPEYAEMEYNRDLVCDEELRYIGRYEKYGNFNRIFYDTTGRNDNFIVHLVQNLTMYAPMRPIDNSFETFDEFNDDNSVSLEHAQPMNYKYIFKPLGITSQRFKLNFGPFASFAAGAFNAILQQKTNDENISAQNEINKQNIKNQWDMFHAQNNRQDYLNANQDLIKRQSLQRAGLNLWSQFGGNPNVATNAISQPEQKTVPKVSPQMDSVFAQMLQQQPLVDAQAELTKQQAKRQEIENRRMQSEDAQYSVEDAMAYVKDNPKAPLPEIEVVPKNKGWFDAKRNYNAFRGEEGDTMVKRVDGFIKNAQYLDEEVRNAIVQLPVSVRKKVLEETALAVAKASESRANKAYIDAQKSYTELKEKLEKDNNIMPYIDKIFMGDFGFDDFCKLMVLGVIAARR